MTDSLAVFLLARFDEFESSARYAQHRGAPDEFDWGGWWLGHYHHYSKHDPTYVLADIATKRRIVERYVYLAENGDDGDARWVLPLLALPFADHSDFKPEWKKQP